MKVIRSLVRAALFAGAVAAVSTPAGAQSRSWVATLNGPSESPSVPSPGVGFATFFFSPANHMLTMSVSFSNLLQFTSNGSASGTTASHVHCCTTSPLTGTANVATQVPTFVGFPLGVRAGDYTNSFDLTLASSYNPAFITANGGTTASAEAALIQGMSEGRAYLNIHTNAFTGGEIRGFLITTPEPGSVLLMSAGLLAVGGLSWRRRRRA